MGPDPDIDIMRRIGQAQARRDWLRYLARHGHLDARTADSAIARLTEVEGRLVASWHAMCR